jgi:hypothetical protein
MLGFGAAAGFTAAPKASARQVTTSASAPLSAAAQTDRFGAKVR